MLLSGRARCREATALAAAVLCLVRIAPSIMASHAPMSRETRTTTERCRGSEAAGLSGMSARNLTIARPCRSASAAMGRNQAVLESSERVIGAGWHARPDEISACAVSTAPITSAIGTRPSTSERVRRRVYLNVATLPPVRRSSANGSNWHICTSVKINTKDAAEFKRR